MRLVTLTTDFGTGDPFVGIMKGVILARTPGTTIVDVAHGLPPQDVRAGALVLRHAVPYFPTGTVFLVVVDPGVGSARRGIAADTGDYRFVAPDNGVLTAVLKESPARRVVELTERRYARARPSVWRSRLSSMDGVVGQERRWPPRSRSPRKRLERRVSGIPE